MGYLIGSLPMGVIVARLTGATDPQNNGWKWVNGADTIWDGTNTIITIREPVANEGAGAIADSCETIQGQISDVRVWSRSLGSGEVTDLYNNWDVLGAINVAPTVGWNTPAPGTWVGAPYDFDGLASDILSVTVDDPDGAVTIVDAKRLAKNA